MKLSTLFGLLICCIVVVSCKKTIENPDATFKCECGTITFKGAEYPLLMAEYIQTNDSLPFSRKYFLTADLSPETEVDNFLNMNMTIPNALGGVFPLSLNPEIDIQIEQVNIEQNIDEVSRFEVLDGTVNVSPALLAGDSENVSMTISIVPIDGPAGSTFTIFSSAFTVLAD